METCILIWIAVVNQLVLLTSNFPIVNRHRNKLLQLFNISNKIHYPIIIFSGVYRLLVVTMFRYLYNYDGLLLLVGNLVAIVIGIRWFVYCFIKKKPIETEALLFLNNFLEFLIHLCSTNSTEPFIYIWSRIYIIFNIATIFLVVYLINILYQRELMVLKNKIAKPRKKEVNFVAIDFKKNPILENICAICHDSYDNNSIYYLLDCSSHHHGHATCFENWWSITNINKCLYHCKTNL